MFDVNLKIHEVKEAIVRFLLACADHEGKTDGMCT